jgi:acyl-CoA synthetase (AMP-forming)/AMP-acid ligase II
VVDRKDDMIVSGGENIYCPEVETALGSHPGVAEAAVVGVPHPRWGQTPLAVVVAVDATTTPDPDDLIAWCRERIASYKKPTAIVFADALPRNAGGKVLKGILRQRYGSGSKQFEHG